MTNDPKAAARLADAVARLRATGAVDLLSELIRNVWSTNVARFDDAAGDTPRVIAIQSAENIAVRIKRRVRDDPPWRATGLEVTTPNNSLLIELDELRFHIVKAPLDARLRPDWGHDFAWEAMSRVREESAAANDRVYLAPKIEPNMEPFAMGEGLEGVGNPDDVNEFFLVWAGLLNEQPLTRGWMIVPSMASNPVIAVDELWTDQRQDDAAPVVGSETASEPTVEPEVAIRLKKHVAEAADGQ